MALEFDEQLSRLEKPNRNEMTNKEYAVFNAVSYTHLTLPTILRV